MIYKLPASVALQQQHEYTITSFTGGENIWGLLLLQTCMARLLLNNEAGDGGKHQKCPATEMCVHAQLKELVDAQ